MTQRKNRIMANVQIDTHVFHAFLFWFFSEFTILNLILFAVYFLLLKFATIKIYNLFILGGIKFLKRHPLFTNLMITN